MEAMIQCNCRTELMFVAILELCRTGRVRAHQHNTFGDIRLFAFDHESAAT